MWVIVGLGAVFVVLGVLTLVFPDRASSADRGFSTVKTRQLDPNHWTGQPRARIRLAGICMGIVGTLVVIAGFVGSNHAK